MKLSDIKIGMPVKLTKDFDMIGAARRVDKPFKVFAIHDDGRIELTSDGRHVALDSSLLAAIEPVPTPVQEIAQVFARIIGDRAGGEFMLQGEEVAATKCTAQENRILMRLDNGLLVTMTLTAVKDTPEEPIYRMLSPEERIQKGDEWFDGVYKQWAPASCVGMSVNNATYRRRV